MSALEKQANQLGQQASQECERLAQDKTLTLQMLQKVQNTILKGIFYETNEAAENVNVVFLG